MSYYHHQFILYVDAQDASCDVGGLNNADTLKRIVPRDRLQDRIRKGNTIIRITVNPIGKIV